MFLLTLGLSLTLFTPQVHPLLKHGVLFVTISYLNDPCVVYEAGIFIYYSRIQQSDILGFNC